MDQKPDSFQFLSFQYDLENIKLIGTGGMAKVYRAWQPSLERFLVIKKLKEEFLLSEEIKKRFRREAKVLASVLHQNIAHVYDYMETEREAIILMEHIEGIDLSTVIIKLGPLSSNVALSILLGVAKGVGFMHAHQLIHRDIKPSNIRLTPKGEVKLMDFGIVMEIEKEALTRPGMMVGSPQYLSPEQILGDPITPKADLFVLGICLYEMLTGTRPFKEEGGQTVFQKIREVSYIPLREMQPNVPKVIEKIVEKCLQKDPANRYSSAYELIAEAEEVLKQRPEPVLLKFLDEEALVSKVAPYIEVKTRNKSMLDMKWAIAIAVFSALLFSFVAYYLGVQKGESKGFGTQGIKTVTPPHH